MCVKISKKVSIFSKFSLLLIRIYQKSFSAAVGRQCRFYPTCSDYTAQAIIKYGFIKGWYLGIKRIIKCNPWGPHGFDPVPNNDKNKESK